MSARLRVLIAGCGYVGARLAAELLRAGHEVFALRRRAQAAPPGAHALQADLTRAETLAALPRALDAVVFAPTPDVRDAAGYERTYVQGARNLLAQVTRDGARPRWLHLSSTGVYAQDGGEWVDETTDPEASSAGAERVTARGLSREVRRACLLASEEVARAAGLRCTVLRLAGIYGPGRTGMLRRARARDADGADARAAAPRFANRIHRDDAAGAAAHLLQLRAPEALYLGVDCAPVLEAEVLDWLAARLDAASPAHARSEAAAPAPSPAHVSPALPARGKRCRNARLLASGYRFRFVDYRAGYGALIGTG